MTSHLDDGTLQAFLDDELPPGERADAAEHLLACRRCRTTKDELAQAHAAFSEAVSVLDVEAPAATAPPAGRRPGVAGSLIKAASLVLLVAAAASAAVPGSPVREWIVRAVEPTPEAVTEPAPAPTPTPTPEPAPAPIPVGVSLLSTQQPVDVVLRGLTDVRVRLLETGRSGVSVSAVGADSDPVFETSPGSIRVRDGVGGELTVEWSASLDTARLLVDGELYAEKVDGELRVHVPADRVEGAHIWP
ncbi:MAG: zf-HC2 domain-containing protein [Longimicrobiales bacterium]|nr:zf-HC2 domain-containing protein [Longimicrobiales bacterium]